MLFDHNEILEEGAKTNEMNAIVDAYKDTIKKIDADVNEAKANKEYAKAEKLLLEKKRILETIEKSVMNVDVTSWDSFKGNFGIGMFIVPSAVRVTRWAGKLGSPNKIGQGLSYAAIMGLCNALTVAIGAYGVCAMVYTHSKAYGVDKLKKEAYQHPSKTNLMKVIEITKKSVNAEIDQVKKMKSTKENYTDFDFMIESFIDITLEEYIQE